MGVLGGKAKRPKDADRSPDATHLYGPYIKGQGYNHINVAKEVMLGAGLTKLFVQGVILWNSILFLPIVLLLCYFGTTRALLKKLYVLADFSATLEAVRRLPASVIERLVRAGPTTDPMELSKAITWLCTT
jgi:hypothetical protein